MGTVPLHSSITGGKQRFRSPPSPCQLIVPFWLSLWVRVVLLEPDHVYGVQTKLDKMRNILSCPV
jgi:hypothetical protein